MGKNHAKQVYKFVLAREYTDRAERRRASTSSSSRRSSSSRMRRFNSDGAVRAGYISIQQSSPTPYGASAAIMNEGSDMYAPRVFCFRDRDDGIEHDRRPETRRKLIWDSFRMIVYQYDTVVLAVLVDDLGIDDSWNKTALLSFCGSLEKFIEPELAQLWQNIKRSHAGSARQRAASAQGASIENDYKFLYSNDANRVLKASAAFLKGFDSSATSSSSPGSGGAINALPARPSTMGDSLPTAVLHALDEMYVKFEETPPYVDSSRFATKAHSADHHRSGDEASWVMGLDSGDRRLYAIFDGKLNLVDAHLRFSRLQNSYFQNIFLSDAPPP